MATLTQVQRDNQPKRFVRKDARRMIYDAIFDTTNSDKINDPMQRRLRQDYDHHYAVQQFLSFYDLAEFSASRLAELCKLLKIELPKSKN